MILILIIGLFLAGSAVALFARAMAKPRLQATETVAEVRSYGFNARAARSAPGERRHHDLSLLELLDRLAVAIGGVFSKRFPSLSVSATRKHLTAAGMYTTNPLKVIGYQVLAGVGLPALWLWLSIASH